MTKTNVIRILEARGIEHTVVTYEYKEDEIDAITVAGKIGADAEIVFKTLVSIGDNNGINVFCIPANTELDLKKAAKISNNKRLEMLKIKNLHAVTGYIRGGCSPIGMKKNFPVFINETAQLYKNIYISAGIKGMQVKLSPNDLCTLINSVYADLT